MSDANETTKQPTQSATTPPSLTSRQALNRFNAVIGYLISVLVACAVMMWSVFNIWLNVLMYRADAADVNTDNNWGIATGVVVVTCVVPFLLGLLLLFKTLGKEQKKIG